MATPSPVASKLRFPEAVCDGVATRAEGRGGAEADLPPGHRAAQVRVTFQRRVGRKQHL